ncbi:MAG: class I SAM-dependent methyltransferase [Patescibacteria group bacterium]
MLKNSQFRKYGQYKSDIFEKMGLDLSMGKKLLDIGCGDGVDSEIFINEFGLDVYGMDIYEDQNIKNIKGLKFQKAGIHQIPFQDNAFDYVFLHDVLHHIDEKEQSSQKHISGLLELKRVCKVGGKVIILEGNRYNPLFYPHMVLMKKHNHFKQKYFQRIIKEVFDDVNFRSFEAHSYPRKFLNFFKIYERFMEKAHPLKRFLAYNLAVIKK